MMIVATIFLLSLTATLVSCGNNPTVHLPPDADFVTVIGDGFKLQISKLNDIKGRWNDVADATNQVNEPRRNKISSFAPVVNKNLFEQVKEKVGQQELGPMNKDLQDWIDAQGRALSDKIDRYERELASARNQQRVVVQLLLLNTLVDLENLSRENLKSLKWVKRKLKAYKSLKDESASSIEEWIQVKIEDNKAIEKSVKGKNDPGDKWLTNTKAIKRVLLEQRFSDKIAKSVVEFLAGSFAMMERSRVYDLFTKDKKIDDGLFYPGSNGKIPAHFPFSAQDAIVNEA